MQHSQVLLLWRYPDRRCGCILPERRRSGRPGGWWCSFPIRRAPPERIEHQKRWEQKHRRGGGRANSGSPAPPSVPGARWRTRPWGFPSWKKQRVRFSGVSAGARCGGQAEVDRPVCVAEVNAVELHFPQFEQQIPGVHLVVHLQVNRSVSTEQLRPPRWPWRRIRTSWSSSKSLNILSMSINDVWIILWSTNTLIETQTFVKKRRFGGCCFFYSYL